MSEMKGIRKLLVLMLTVSTMLCVVAVAVKFGDKNRPPVGPVAEGPNDEGKFNKLPPDKGPAPEASYQQAVSSINEDDLKKELYYLAGTETEGRMSGKAGNKLAADYVQRYFERCGLQTMLHKFKMGRYNPGPKNEQGDDFSSNIYGWIEGTDPALKDEVVVIGAHMDHLGYGPKGSQAPGRTGQIHPGADDNASGTVALLEIARAYSMMKGRCKRTTVFMAFSGEEMGLIGSKFYVENPVFPKSGPSIQKHVAMINMDMIGYLKKGTFLASFDNEASSPDLDRIITDLNGKYSFAKSISGRGAGGSDHAPFYNKRVPVVCLHTGMHKNYHTPDDTPDKINYKGLEQVTRYAFELSWRVSSGETRPEFNLARFVPMSTEHDHGDPARPFGKE